ncbi:hypothetical protein ACFYNY_24115 [Streptomyces sp. NPDC006530]|uniref:hypothetical protein n=1 Tax=Streptomyces sp. NPDC006530 TaxID=3364750 RepID=UPI0036B5CF3C
MWTVYGPLTGLTLENVTTNQSFRLRDSVTVPAGKALVIDTRPGIKTVQLDGMNAWPQMTSDSALWPLRPE